jgi:sulfur carrier protein ThiS
MARTTFSGPVVSQNGFIQGHQPTALNAINTTGTATAAQVADGYITSTSAAPVTITLPTGTDLGTALGASRGTVLDLFIDNTAGASTVTVAVNTNAVLSSAAVDTAGSFGDLTIAAGATGIARFTLMFSSATAYTFTRTA